MLKILFLLKSSNTQGLAADIASDQLWVTIFQYDLLESDKTYFGG